MKAKAVAVAGLYLFASTAWAQPPGKPGVTGALGEELFYNYVEAYIGAAYSDKGGRNLRVFSDTAYGVTGSMFLADPVYLVASYGYSEQSYNQTGAFAGQSRIDSETEQTSVGLGVHVPLGYATDLFFVGTYELVDGFERQQQANTATNSPLDAEGGGYEVGMRSFISGFAELSLSFRYREVREDRKTAVSGGAAQREILKDRFGVISVVVPLVSQLSLFGRAEFGEKDSNFSNADTDFENFQIGARLNFRL
jgi:hypothetical protein